MPEIADVIPGDDVIDTWGNQIRDRTNMRYSSQANLEASEPGAADGSLRWTDDNGLLLRVAGVWEPVAIEVDGKFLPLTGGAGVDSTLTGFLDIHRSGSGMIVMKRLGQGGVDGTQASFQLSGGLLIQVGSEDGTITPVTVVNMASARFWVAPVAVDVRLQGAASFATTATANMAIPDLGNGLIRIATSARRFKSNIEDAPQLADIVLEPKTFYREDDDRELSGFIAEDLADQDERLALYDDDGEVINFSDRGVLAILAAKVNALEAQLAALTP